MAVYGAQIGVPSNCGLGCGTRNRCVDTLGCPPDVCPDFTIRRFGTKPTFRVSVEDCGGPMDLTDTLLVAEVNIWAQARLKSALALDTEYFQLANNIGFEQIMVGDTIVMDRVRNPEHMIVTAFDENNRLVKVQRGANNTTISTWKKGNLIRIFRAINKPATIISEFQDITKEDGTVQKNQLVQTFLGYDFDASDTCLPGCYWFEFKLMRMTPPPQEMLMGLDPLNFTPDNLTPADFSCELPEGVDWIRRFPENTHAFLIKIIDSPTAEV